MCVYMCACIQVAVALAYPYDLPSSAKSEQDKEALFIEALEWLIDSSTDAAFTATITANDNGNNDEVQEGVDDTTDADGDSIAEEGMVLEDTPLEANEIEIEMTCMMRATWSADTLDGSGNDNDTDALACTN
jgi:hypothetical protein